MAERPGAEMFDRLEEFRTFACHLADQSAKITLAHFRSALAVENKAANQHFDPVTEADRRTEHTLRALIHDRYPEHGIRGEEFEDVAAKGPLTWVLDPIDGTRSFIAGVPLWSTLIALDHHTIPVLGLIDLPYLGERFIGLCTDEHRHGEFLTRAGGFALRTRPCTRLDQAVLTCTTPEMFTTERERKAFDRIAGRCRLTRYSMDAYGYGLLAAGQLDLVVESSLAAYDVHALVPIVEAAGGRITDWRGGAPLAGGQVVAAATAELHAQALEHLAPAAGR